MQTRFVVGVAAALGAVGCASTNASIERGERDFSGVAHRSVSSMRVGETHVVDTRVNPLVPVRISFDRTRGSLEWGHRALAQAFNPDCSPGGAPVVISPAAVDVMGAPRVITTDGRHIVATFAAASGNSFQLMAVPIEDAAPAASAELTARR